MLLWEGMGAVITDEDVLRGMRALEEFNSTHPAVDHQGEYFPLRIRAVLESLVVPDTTDWEFGVRYRSPRGFEVAPMGAEAARETAKRSEDYTLAKRERARPPGPWLYAGEQ